MTIPPGAPTAPRPLPTPPPPPPPVAGSGLMQVLLPMMGGLGMVVFMIAGRNTVMVIVGVLMLTVTVTGALSAFVSSRTGPRRAFRAARAEYLDLLEQVRETVRATGAARRAEDERRHPAPDAFAATVGVGVADTARRDAATTVPEVRVACGAAPHPLPLRVPDAPADHTTRRAMESVVASGRHLPASPLVVDLSPGVLLVDGEVDAVRGITRTLLLRLVAARPATRLAVVTTDITAWAWARWLPQLQNRQGHLRLDEVGPSGGVDLVVVDVGCHWGGDRAGLCLVQLAPGTEPAGSHALLTLDSTGLASYRAADGSRWEGDAEPTDSRLAEVLARAMAGRSHQVRDGDADGGTSGLSVLDVASISDFEPEAAWSSLDESRLLTGVVGVDATGSRLEIDLKESGRGGVGPHGLVVGATGSGKSELLRSLVLSLAARHHPRDLAFVLVDFKGGATFAGLESLPHVAGMLTNLGDSMALVDRMQAALNGEMKRRQQVLHDAGHLSDIYALRAARAAGASEVDLPHLLLVVDEFAELLTAAPDLADLFTAIGRIGRSIGIHQLLASQRLDDGRLRGLESFLSYRFALRTFTAEESRSVIGSTAAAELPSSPGCGYLRTVDTVRFQAAYVSGPIPGRVVQDVDAPVTPTPWWPLHDAPAPMDGEGPTILESAVAMMTTSAAPTRRIWLPPLPEAVMPSDLPATPPPRPLTARIGLVDLPAEQRVLALDIDLLRSGGHLAVLGAPGSGRSTTLRTIARSLADRHTPSEVVLHAVDLDGDGLRPLTHLPHVSAVAGRADADLTRRILRELVRAVDGRRPDRAPGRHDVLLLDGYAALREDETLHDQVVTLARRGRDAGVHVIVTAARWHDLRASLQTSITERLELRLAEPMDSIVDRRLAGHISPDTPGRGLLGVGTSVQIALPTDGDEIEAYRAIAELHPCRAAPVALLPVDVPLPVGMRHDPSGTLWIGVGEDELAPLAVGTDSPHLVVVGDRRSGRTGVLRSVLAQTLTDPDAVVGLIDPRRTMIDDVPSAHLAGYATNGTDAAPLVESLAAELTARAERRRTGGSSDGEGRILLLVDDAELLSGAFDPLLPLLPHLPVADELGFTLVLARHAGGVGRAVYEPVMQRLREVGATGVLLSGPVDEGPVWHSVALRPLPPGRATLARRCETPQLVQCYRA